MQGSRTNRVRQKTKIRKKWTGLFSGKVKEFRSVKSIPYVKTNLTGQFSKHDKPWWRGRKLLESVVHSHVRTIRWRLTNMYPSSHSAKNFFGTSYTSLKYLIHSSTLSIKTIWRQLCQLLSITSNFLIWGNGSLLYPSLFWVKYNYVFLLYRVSILFGVETLRQ